MSRDPSEFARHAIEGGGGGKFLGQESCQKFCHTKGLLRS